MKPLMLIAIAMLGSICSSAQLKLVKDINPGYYEASHPKIVGGLPDGRVFLFAETKADSENGYELWTSDGTAQGTKIVKDIVPGKNPSTFAYTAKMFNHKLCFSARNDTSGYEMFLSDGTDTGTYMLMEGFGTASTILYNTPITVYNGRMYFAARDSTHGYELWSSDGTPQGTAMVADIRQGSTGSNPMKMIPAFGKLMFLANDSLHGYEWWITDGTAQGTKMVADVYPGDTSGISQTYYKVYNSYLYFSGRSSKQQGFELYATDGDSVWLVKEIESTVNIGGDPAYFSIAGNKLFFTAHDVMHGRELWMTDGTTNGTVLVKDIWPGDTSSAFLLHGEVNGKLILGASTKATGYELWVSDGTATGTTLIRDMCPGTSAGKIDTRAEFETYARQNECNFIYNNKFYFAGNECQNDWMQLWETDGTAQGTVKIPCNEPAPPLPGIHFNEIEWLNIVNKKVWVAYKPGAEDWELYVHQLPDTPSNITTVSGHIRTSIVYPNPSNGSFILKLDNNGFLNGYMQVVDITGREVYSQSISSGERHLPITLEAPTGIYKAIVQLDGDIMTHTIQIE